MAYTEQIKQDMYIAMKSGDKVKTNIIFSITCYVAHIIPICFS